MDYQGPEVVVNNPPNSTINQQNNVGLRSRAKAVKILAILELILTIFCAIAGIAEVIMASSLYWCEDDYGHYYCHFTFAIGQGIWCSVFPFIACVIGILVSKNPTNQQKVRLLNGFSVVACISMGVLATLEFCFPYYWYTPYRSLQICIICASLINFILFTISASYSCCLGCNGCCNDGQQQQGTVYIAYTTPGNLPAYSLPTGMQGYPQPQVVMVNPAQLQDLQQQIQAQAQLQGQQQAQLQGLQQQIQAQAQLQGQQQAQLQGLQQQQQQIQAQQQAQLQGLQQQQIQAQLQGQQIQGQQFQGQHINPGFVQAQPPPISTSETQVNPPPAYQKQV